MLPLLCILSSSSTTVFWASAVIGSALFAFRIVMLFVGSAFDADDIDFDDDVHHSESSFKVFTLHSISGFFMMFGWVGLACLQRTQLSYQSMYGFAFLAGVCTMFITALILKMAHKLESAGIVFNTNNLVGLTGTVYQQIPEHGQGKIQVIVHGVTREIIAQSHLGKQIDSFVVVKIVRIVDHEIVEVIQQS